MITCDIRTFLRRLGQSCCVAWLYASSAQAEENIFAPPPLPQQTNQPTPTQTDPELYRLPAPKPEVMRRKLPRLPKTDDASADMILANVPLKKEEKPWDNEPLPPLDQELWQHGGSYLYCPEGDHLGWPGEEQHTGYELLRLPEDYVEPEPFTLFSTFLGEEPVKSHPLLHWFGPGAYNWDPRFVAYGSYQASAIAYKQNQTRSDGLGHQLIVDLDLRLTGTERFHVQFRPLGEGSTGGSYYRFNDPAGYIDNSTGAPQRFWFEGELHSIFSGYADPFAVRDINLAVGKFPFLLQNQLLMNDEVLGLALSKNTIFVGNTSNLNVQGIYAPSDVDNVADANSRMYGISGFLDYQRVFYETSYLFIETPDAPGRNQHFYAIARTALYGQLTCTGRALFKFGDNAGSGGGELYVLETNYTQVFPTHPLGIEMGVGYCNLFYATEGWNSAAGGGFNRLRAAFDVNPLVGISTGMTLGENYGVSLGMQFFRHHEDESIAPEFAFQSLNGDAIYGLGLRYQRKTGKRTFFEVLGLVNFSENAALRRDGVFISETILF
ncbi:hypothetical protein DTL21_24165 [Bremerella cremea]|uniref:Alginate export domain-containing protein n=1 Tax=Blastopirellula marina TaxID=124 RepID=A0A2S8FE84_9BACT|nr:MULTISPECIES: hypothetical protein [Pirellulaceae]PQO30452.1 hypothetical protein C5Y83_24120 [Blastopirellula marina]RCS43805.1 hypothetical protein DTL21_24165 [Bremerella cremea]